jgi:hypothetical protein
MATGLAQNRDGATGHSVLYAFGGAGICALLMIGAMVSNPRSASAVPSFARQTGQPCASCHNGAFPQLTPYGRMFKLNGYTAGGTKCHDSPEREGPPTAEDIFRQIPIAAMVVPTFTHQQKDLPDLPTNRRGDTNGLKTNNNAMVQDVSVFYGGQIYCQLGAFSQATYDRVDEAFFLDNTDIRYADHTKIAGFDVLFGFDANNNPTVQDPWNTTPAWRIPGGGSVASAFAPGPATPLVENLGGIVGGGGAYLFIDNSIYLEASAYKTLDRKTLSFLGEGAPSISMDGVAPYWRAAYEKTLGDYTFMVGTYGIVASFRPDVTSVSPNDHVTDVGFDSQFQYLRDEHFFTARASYTYEWEKLDGSTAIGAAANLSNHLASLNLSATYAYDSTYALTLGYFNTQGSNDLGPGDVSYFGSPTGSPNGSGEVIDIGYMPWSHGGPSLWPWLNTRFGLSFTHFDKLNGVSTNYDGAGRNTKDDNTTFLYAWTAF